MATKLPALNLRHTVSPREIQDLASVAVSELVGGGTPPAGSGYAANPHTLSGATHTGLLASSQATQFAYNEGNGADDDSDRSAYNANRMTGGKAHVVPVTTDTYDLGTSSKWWRSQYVSQINAAIFAENVIQLLGGWFIVGHNQGTLESAVATGTTDIDFGTALSVNDFILIKSHDTAGTAKTEYMQVSAAVSGTTYTVTRDLASAHVTDPAWAIGTPFLVLGYTGDGRIEFDAYDTPRIQLFTQGSTYNAQTEVVRVGDLNANWGYVAETYGIAMGDYQSGVANVCIDATNGVRLRSYQTTKIQLQPDGDVFIGSDISAAATTQLAVFTNAQTYNSESVGAGDLLIGDNTASKANIFWDYSAGTLSFRGGTTPQVQIGTDGSLAGGTGKVTINANGIGVSVGETQADISAYTLNDGGTLLGGLYGWTFALSALALDAQAQTNKDTYLGLWAGAPTAFQAQVTLRANSAAVSTNLNIFADDNASPTTWGSTNVSTFDFSGNITVGGTVDGIDVAGHTHGGAGQGGTVDHANLNNKGTNSHSTIDSHIAATGSSVHGLGTISTQASNAVAITGGTISGLTTLGASAAAITGGSVIGLTDLQVGSGTRKAFTVSQTNADVYIGSDSQDGDLYMRKLDGTGTVHLIGSSGDIYIDNNMSALSFTDRTPHFVGDALEAIRGIKGDAKSLDHKTLPAFAQYQNIRKHRASGGTEEVTTTTERNLGNMVTLLTVAVQQLLDRVEKIEQVAHI